MKNSLFTKTTQLLGIATIALTVAAVSTPTPAMARGGSGGGGGGGKVVSESRVTGYVTAIDYSAHTITIGASYYGNGALIVTSNTKISIGASNGTFDQIKMGDWVEARYNFSTKEATKLSVGSSL